MLEIQKTKSDYLPTRNQDQPSKHETLTQCWVNIGSSSLTLAQHFPTIEQTSCVSCELKSLNKAFIYLAGILEQLEKVYLAIISQQVSVNSLWNVRMFSSTALAVATFCLARRAAALVLLQ